MRSATVGPDNDGDLRSNALFLHQYCQAGLQNGDLLVEPVDMRAGIAAVDARFAFEEPAVFFAYPEIQGALRIGHRGAAHGGNRALTSAPAPFLRGKLS